MHLQITATATAVIIETTSSPCLQGSICHMIALHRICSAWRENILAVYF